MEQKPRYDAFSEADYFSKINTPALNPEYFHRFHRPIIDEAKRETGSGEIKLLDVACGFARELDFIKNDPQIQIIGIDIAEKTLKEARKRLTTRDNKPIFVVADTEHNPLRDNTIDVGLALNAFAYKPDRVLGMLYKALKPGKKCVMNFRIYGNPFNESFFQYSLERGAVLEDDILEVQTSEGIKHFPLKVLDCRQSVDEQTRNLDRQVFLTSFQDAEDLIRAVGLEIVNHEAFHFSSVANRDNEMDVFTLKKPEN